MNTYQLSREIIRLVKEGSVLSEEEIFVCVSGPIDWDGGEEKFKVTFEKFKKALNLLVKDGKLERMESPIFSGYFYRKPIAKAMRNKLPLEQLYTMMGFALDDIDLFTKCKKEGLLPGNASLYEANQTRREEWKIKHKRV